jgi:hypothetical protein
VIFAAVLFAGCWLEEPTYVVEYFYYEVSLQATVKNTSSKDISVSLLPAVGSRTDSIYHVYQWRFGLNEIIKHPDLSYPTATADLAANSTEAAVLRTNLGQSTYAGFQVGDEILSFLLQIDENEYAGWNTKKYGTGDRTLVDQGYGYAVLLEDSRLDIYWNSSLSPVKEYTIGVFCFVTLRYTITIADSGVEFVLDEVAHGERQADWVFQE